MNINKLRDIDLSQAFRLISVATEAVQFEIRGMTIVLFTMLQNHFVHNPRLLTRVKITAFKIDSHRNITAALGFRGIETKSYLRTISTSPSTSCDLIPQACIQSNTPCTVLHLCQELYCILRTGLL
jgi:hypothetical protein